MVMGWSIFTVAEFRIWFMALTDTEQDEITAVMRLLAAEGPTLGRPFVDRVATSKCHNMEELRPRGGAKHIRILFIFDPRRAAVLLLGRTRKANGTPGTAEPYPRRTAATNGTAGRQG